MTKLKSVFCASLLIVLASAAAHAQASRTWVSGVGDDVNACSRTAPCKTFAGAIQKTANGGEIDALDPGGFGSVIISKSITIDGNGVLAGVLASANSTGIIINTTQVKEREKAVVRLRGLSINGVGTGRNGIDIREAGSVSIEDCVIDGFKENGILVSSGNVFVRNTTIRNNVIAGITVAAGLAPPRKAALADVALVFNGVGISGNVKQLGNVYLFGNKTGDPA